jgi:dienelactone hydrolase
MTLPRSDRAAATVAVAIASGTVVLDGALCVPADARGVVVFAHGSGSSRHSPRNLQVAEALHQAGFGTLLFDLLTRDEDRTYATRFDIALLTERLLAATVFLRMRAELGDRPIGYFGASTGAAAALAAAALDGHVAAVVSRGGRPDLTPGDLLPKVRAPSLLIVGGADLEVLMLNRQAYAALRAEKTLQIVPGATHLFEEPGALDEVIALAIAWFGRWMPAPQQ